MMMMLLRTELLLILKLMITIHHQNMLLRLNQAPRAQSHDSATRIINLNMSCVIRTPYTF